MDDNSYFGGHLGSSDDEEWIPGMRQHRVVKRDGRYYLLDTPSDDSETDSNDSAMSSAADDSNADNSDADDSNADDSDADDSKNRGTSESDASKSDASESDTSEKEVPTRRCPRRSLRIRRQRSVDGCLRSRLKGESQTGLNPAKRRNRGENPSRKKFLRIL
ncbi:MAG: uncharacterized protein KVP18_002382 [Porospora cf. gigantea A]|uniref:uncharacterized protein n=1 Tax=Porospora cf. gigantea A TaxID=2853593 RepID=UPI00355A014E|nr:MAG: hypothetical protein KVP18_002382 [Porospora cf. gigantea A]